MNILISTIFWGKGHAVNFTDYSLASLMASQNFPTAAREHTITVLVFTEAHRIEEFKKSRIYQDSLSFVRYEFLSFEKYGIQSRHIPGSYDTKKYSFLSTCQNIVIQISRDYDIHVFNYSDFIWANGSLARLISSFQTTDIFAVLGFCIPADEKKIKAALAPGVVDLTAHQAVNLALDNLHSETKLRNWNAQEFSKAPSYIYWEVPENGMILRTFHPTLLAVTPIKRSPVYDRGITQGTLDSGFSSEICMGEKSIMATDSDVFFVFSMHNSMADSRSGKSKQDTLKEFIKCSVCKQHVHSFKNAYLFKRKHNPDADFWKTQIEASWLDMASMCDEKELADDIHVEEPVVAPNCWAQQSSAVGQFIRNRLKPALLYYTKNTIKKLIGPYARSTK